MSSSPIASRSVVTFQDKSASWNGQNRNTLIHASDKVDHGSRALTTPKPPVVSRGTDSPTRFHPMPRRKMMPAARPRRAPDDAKAPIPTPGFYNDAADSKRPRAYFSFFALAPLTLAVPRSVFCRFLRCLPARGVSTLLCCNGNEIWLDGIDAGSRRACRGLGPRTLLSAGALGLGGHANADQAVVGLELLHGLGGVVDQAKPVVLPPPNWVRRPKTWTWSFWALYMPPSFSRSSSLEMLARLGWRMSLRQSQLLVLQSFSRVLCVAAVGIACRLARGCPARSSTSPPTIAACLLETVPGGHKQVGIRSCFRGGRAFDRQDGCFDGRLSDSRSRGRGGGRDEVQWR